MAEGEPGTGTPTWGLVSGAGAGSGGGGGGGTRGTSIGVATAQTYFQYGYGFGDPRSPMSKKSSPITVEGGSSVNVAPGSFVPAEEQAKFKEIARQADINYLSNALTLPPGAISETMLAQLGAYSYQNRLAQGLGMIERGDSAGLLEIRDIIRAQDTPVKGITLATTTPEFKAAETKPYVPAPYAQFYTAGAMEYNPTPMNPNAIFDIIGTSEGGGYIVKLADNTKIRNVIGFEGDKLQIYRDPNKLREIESKDPYDIIERNMLKDLAKVSKAQAHIESETHPPFNLIAPLKNLSMNASDYLTIQATKEKATGAIPFAGEIGYTSLATIASIPTMFIQAPEFIGSNIVRARALGQFATRANIEGNYTKLYERLGMAKTFTLSQTTDTWGTMPIPKLSFVTQIATLAALPKLQSKIFETPTPKVTGAKALVFLEGTEERSAGIQTVKINKPLELPPATSSETALSKFLTYELKPNLKAVKETAGAVTVADTTGKILIKLEGTQDLSIFDKFIAKMGNTVTELRAPRDLTLTKPVTTIQPLATITAEFKTTNLGQNLMWKDINVEAFSNVKGYVNFLYRGAPKTPQELTAFQLSEKGIIEPNMLFEQYRQRLLGGTNALNPRNLPSVELAGYPPELPRAIEYTKALTEATIGKKAGVSYSESAPLFKLNTNLGEAELHSGISYGDLTLKGAKDLYMGLKQGKGGIPIESLVINVGKTLRWEDILGTVQEAKFENLGSPAGFSGSMNFLGKGKLNFNELEARIFKQLDGAPSPKLIGEGLPPLQKFDIGGFVRSLPKDFRFAQPRGGTIALGGDVGQVVTTGGGMAQIQRAIPKLAPPQQITSIAIPLTKQLIKEVPKPKMDMGDMGAKWYENYLKDLFNPTDIKQGAGSGMNIGTFNFEKYKPDTGASSRVGLYPYDKLADKLKELTGQRQKQGTDQGQPLPYATITLTGQPPKQPQLITPIEMPLLKSLTTVQEEPPAKPPPFEPFIIINPPPGFPGKLGNPFAGDKKKKKKESQLIIKDKPLKFSRSLYSDIISVGISETLYGKGTSPSLEKRPGVWAYASNLFGFVPTVEMIENKKPLKRFKLGGFAI